MESGLDGEIQIQDGLEEMELALLRAAEGLGRWRAECLALVSEMPASNTEATLLQLVCMNGRPKSIKELARLTNRDDIPNIQYALRKLAAAGLISKSGSGRSGVTYSATVEGQNLADSCNKEQRELLVRALSDLPGLTTRLSGATRTLKLLTGLYDEMARTATARRQI